VPAEAEGELEDAIPAAVEGLCGDVETCTFRGEGLKAGVARDESPIECGDTGGELHGASGPHDVAKGGLDGDNRRLIFA
jgi:hypothetical protein